MESERWDRHGLNIPLLIQELDPRDKKSTFRNLENSSPVSYTLDARPEPTT